MSEAEKPKEGSESEPATKENQINRRDFFNEITSGALGIAGLGAAVVTVQYLSPNVLFEPPTSFRVGSPDDYPLGSVSFIENQQVYVVRTAQGFFAESAVCTHLGCITKWNPQANLIQCPCHGSMFQKNGTVAHGPAPRPLPHFQLRLMPDGTLLVDKLEIVPQNQITKI